MKTAAKLLAHWIATALIVPELVSYAIRKAMLGADRALESSSQTLSLLPGLSGAFLRTAFLRRTLAHCDVSARVEFGTLFSKAGARLGRNCYIGPRCCLGLAIIDADVLVAAGVHIPSGPQSHGIADPYQPIREQAGRVAAVHIGEGSWIGANSVVMADVGRHCVIGAGSVVTRPIPDGSIAVGAPARVIRSRESSEVSDSCAMITESRFCGEPHLELSR